MDKKNIALLLLAVLIAALPLFLLPEAEFAGADGQAEELIGEIAPDYEPWAEPLITLPSGEVESLLFALQAALGAGTIGFILGSMRERHRQEGQHAQS